MFFFFVIKYNSTKDKYSNLDESCKICVSGLGLNFGTIELIGIVDITKSDLIDLLSVFTRKDLSNLTL